MQQNNTLRFTKGYIKTTPIDYLRQETKTLMVKDQIYLKGTQFDNRASIHIYQPLHHTLHTAPTHRNIRMTLSTHYNGELKTIPTAPSGTSRATHIHNTLASRFISKL